MKKMNRKPLAIEDGTPGVPRVNSREFKDALDAWAKRRGINFNETWAQKNARLYKKKGEK